MNLIDIINKANQVVTIIQAVILFPLGLLIPIFHICWCAYLINDIFRSIKSAERQSHPDDSAFREKYEIQAKKGKLLLVILLLELVAALSYELGFSYPYLSHLVPNLDASGLRINSTCLNQETGYQIETSELQYPEVGFFLSSGRAGIIIAMAVGSSMLRFITNIYDENELKYSDGKYTLLIFIILSILIVILGSIPQVQMLSHLIVIIAYGILLKLLAGQLASLLTALKRREQDLEHNYVTKKKIIMERNERKKFTFFSRYLFIGLIVLYISEVVNSFECVIQLFLSNGNCFFPTLYGIHFQPLLSNSQLARFNLFLALLSMIQKLTVIIGINLTYFPYIVYTILIVIAALRNRAYQNSRSLRFKIHSRNTEI